MAGREYSVVVEAKSSDELGNSSADLTPVRTVGRVQDHAELQGLLQGISNLGVTEAGAGVSS